MARLQTAVGVGLVATLIWVGLHRREVVQQEQAEEAAVAATQTPEEPQTEAEDQIPDEVIPAMVGAVEIQPKLAKLTTTLRALVTTAEGFTLRYEWEVNGRGYGLQIADSFAGHFRRDDLVRVIVTPYKAGVAGISMASEPVKIVNSPPVYTGSLGQGFALDGYKFAVSDPDGDPLRFSLFGAPEGLSIDPDTGVLSFRPASQATAQVAEYDVQVLAEDGQGGEVKVSFPIKVQGG